MKVPDGWTIQYNPKPGPTPEHDWDFWHEDSEELFTASSFEDAIEQIRAALRL